MLGFLMSLYYSSPAVWSRREWFDLWVGAVAGVLANVAGYIPALVTGTGMILNNLIVGVLVLIAASALGGQRKTSGQMGTTAAA